MTTWHELTVEQIISIAKERRDKPQKDAEHYEQKKREAAIKHAFEMKEMEKSHGRIMKFIDELLKENKSLRSSLRDEDRACN